MTCIHGYRSASCHKCRGWGRAEGWGRWIFPTLIAVAFLAGGRAPAHALGGDPAGPIVNMLGKIADSLKDMARNSDRKIEVECSCRCEK